MPGLAGTGDGGGKAPTLDENVTAAVAAQIGGVSGGAGLGDSEEDGEAVGTDRSRVNGGGRGLTQGGTSRHCCYRTLQCKASMVNVSIYAEKEKSGRMWSGSHQGQPSRVLGAFG